MDITNQFAVIDWEPILSGECAKSQFNTFQQIVTSLLDERVPSEAVGISAKNEFTSHGLHQESKIPHRY